MAGSVDGDSTKDGDSVKDKDEDKGASRRKPKVVHKVVEDDDDDVMQIDDSPFKSYQDANGINGHKEEEKKPDEVIDIDEEGNPILPEGETLLYHASCRARIY